MNTTTIDAVTVPVTRHDGAAEAKQRIDAAVREGRELASPEGASDELLHLLPQFGPVISGFARFLATRADLVPPGLRADLFSVPDLTTAAPAAEVLGLLAAAWRANVADVCFQFDDVPLETRFPTQSHRAFLTPTDAVIVTCVPPSFEARVQADLPTLPALSAALAAPLGGADVFEALVADYRRLLQRRLNLGDDVIASEALVADARKFPALIALRPHPGLSSARVAVWDEVAVVSPDTPGFDRAETAASLCRAWLRQALVGRIFPEETELRDIAGAGRRQVAVGGRLFTRLSTEAQVDVQGYMVAVAAGDPDLSIRFLSRLLVPGRSADAAGFQRRMRHAWSVDADAAGGSVLLAQLLLHWRIAVDHGYQPSPGLASFFRGCLAAVRVAEAMGAEDDVLRDSLAALQIRLMASQIESLTGVSPTNARSAREASWRLLTTLAAGPIASDRGAGAAGVPLPVFGSLLLALTAIGVAVPRVIASGAEWADPMGAVLFGILGLVLLYFVTLRRPSF